MCIQFVEADDGVWCALLRFGWTVSKKCRLERASQLESQYWLMMGSSWGHEVAEWETCSLIGPYGISSKVKWRECMYDSSRLDSWAEVGSLQLILEFDKSCRWRRQTQFGSGQISGNQLYVYWRFVWRNRFRLLAKSRSCVDFTEITCWFRSEHLSRDRVSILPRSCVDFAR